MFYEFAAQKALEKKTVTSEEFVSTALAAMGLDSPLPEDEKQTIKNRYAALVAEILPPATQDLITMFAQAVSTQSLSQGIQAILVPHSQGNLFANEVYNSLWSSLPTHLFRGLGVVNVANPANRAPSNLYLTSVQDTVINMLAYLQSFISNSLRPMKANFDASATSREREAWGHGFTEVYLAHDLPLGTTPENSIAAELVKKIDSAMYNTSSFWDNPSYYFPNGVKTQKPPNFPADSTRVQVCFPGPVGGV